MATSIKGITVEIAGDTTQLTSALKNVNSEIKETQSDLKQVEKLLKLDPSNTELCAQKQRELSSEISQTKEKLNTLETAAKSANEQLANGDITQEQYDALQREIIETEQDLEKLCKEAAESNKTLNEIDQVGETMQNVGGQMADVGDKMTKCVTVPIVGAATAAVGTASDFDSSMSRVKALVSSSSDDINGDMEKLEQKAREAGETTKFSASDAADAMQYMGLAGWDAGEMIDGLDPILNLAAASEIDLGSACDIVTDYLSAFGMGADEAGDLVDVMAYAMSNSNTTTEQLGEAYKNCASTATQLGWDLDDTTASLMVMADNGVKGGEAGTALNSVMTRLANNTNGCTDALSEYGIEVYDSSGNLNDFGDIMIQMQGIWGGLTDEQKANLGYLVAGKNAESEFMAVMGDTGSLEEYTEGLNNCNGTAQDMADIMQDNLQGDIDQLMSKLQELAISFGEILMPKIREIVEKISDLIDWFNNLGEGTKEMITKFGGLAAAIGPVLSIGGRLVKWAGKGISKFSEYGEKIYEVVLQFQNGCGWGGKLATAISGLSAPVMAVVGVIAVLVAAFATLWATNEDFRNNIIGTWEEIWGSICDFVDGIKERFEDLGITLPNLGEIVSALKEVWLDFCDVLAPVFEGAFQTIAIVLDTILDVILGILDVFIGLFTGDWDQVWQGVQEIFGGIWDGITGLFQTYMDTIKGVAEAILGWFGSTWEDLWNGVDAFFQGFWNGIYNFFQGIHDGIINIAQNAWNAIQGAIQTVLDTVNNIIQTVWNAISGFIQTIMDTINGIIQGVWQGIQDFFQNILDTISGIFQGAWEYIQNFIQTIMDTISGIVQGVWNGIQNIIQTVMDTISGIISDVWNAISGAVSSILNTISETISNIWSNIQEFVRDTMDNISSAISDIWNNVLEAVSNIVGNIYETIRNAFDNAVQYIQNLVSDAWNWGFDLIQNIINGIWDAVSGIGDAIGNVAETITSYLHFSTPDVGPLSDADEFMPDFMDLLAEGIRGSMKDVVDSVKEVTSEINGALDDDALNADINASVTRSVNLAANASALTENATRTQADIFSANFAQLFKLLNQYFPEFANMQIVMDTGATVGALTPGVDRGLGRIDLMKARGG